jgi:hypothetical protein
VKSAVGVIGTGAMGLGVVQSLARAGMAVRARDIRAEAQAAAVACGAVGCASAAAVARDCGIVIILVVDAAEVDTVVFGADGALSALAPGAIFILSSTVAPSYVAVLSSRLSGAGVRLVDAPVSGGPLRAAAGTMTLIVSGETRDRRLRCCVHGDGRPPICRRRAARDRRNLQGAQQPARSGQSRRRRRSDGRGDPRRDRPAPLSRRGQRKLGCQLDRR